jgi:hypothetical protein
MPIIVTRDGEVIDTTQGGQMLSDFGNDLSGPELLTASGPSNSSKGDNPPQTWMPSTWGNAGMNCAFVKSWVAVKWEWNLTIVQDEQAQLQEIIQDVC